MLPAMSVRAHIFLIVIAVCVGTVAFLGLLSAAMRTADFALLRAEGAGSHLGALHELDGAAGRYGRQVVDQLLFGYDRGGEL